MDLKVLQEAKILELKIKVTEALIEKIEKLLEKSVSKGLIVLDNWMNLEISKEYATQIAEEYLDIKKKELKKLKRDLSEL
jgi:uncharacterized protein YkvS